MGPYVQRDRPCHHLDPSTSFRMALELGGVAPSAEEGKGVKTGKEVVGEPGEGDIRRWELEEAAAAPTAMGMETWRGAVKGLKAGLSRSLTWWRCWASRAISSAGRRTGAGGGVDSTSRNFTNSCENDCTAKRKCHVRPVRSHS